MATTLALLLLATLVWLFLTFLTCHFHSFLQFEVSDIASSNKTPSFISEAHPDMIDSNGVATLEAYNNDLAYLKKKVYLHLA